ncbi:MAG: RadC family protein [Patescibacteria group bacterium]
MKPKLREKLELFGARNLTNSELLTILLSTGNKQLSANQTAQRLLKKFPLKKLQLLKPSELTEHQGIGVAKASQIISAIELGRRNALPITDKITSPTTALPYLTKLRKKQKEWAICLYLNALSELIHSEMIALGGLNYLLLEPKDLLYPAITLPAASFILAHNHPSGSTEPSLADKKTTQKISQVCQLLGVNFLDHLIISKKAHFSFKEAGLMK